jgi:hypothetical protein
MDREPETVEATEGTDKGISVAFVCSGSRQAESTGGPVVPRV